jgi:hypothetical protein
MKLVEFRGEQLLEVSWAVCCIVELLVLPGHHLMMLAVASQHQNAQFASSKVL